MPQRRGEPVVIAVLPLEDLSPNRSSDYFADGLTDEIIRNLSVIDGLAVRSRTSSFAVKGKRQNMHELGNQLAVNYILDGSVLRDGQYLRVSTQLVRVRDDFPIWVGKFDRELTDVFAIQDEIALGMVNSLRLKLGRGRRRYDTNLEVYDLYLRARSLPVQRGGGVGAIASIGLFEKVVAKDPAFAPAYAGLAASYAMRSNARYVDHPADELTRMRAVAEKAIQLDPLLAEAHDALGMVYAREGQWGQAEESFRRAIELDANRSTTYVHSALWLLMVLGRTQEAVHQMRIAEKVDPLSVQVQRDLAFVLISVGRYDEAAEHCQKISAQDRSAHQFLGRARLGQGRINEAIELLTDDGNPGFLGYAYARSGRREEALKLATASGENPFWQTLIYAGLGDRDHAFEALDRMARLGPGRVGQYLTFPELAVLRGDPRLKALRKKVGLPE